MIRTITSSSSCSTVAATSRRLLLSSIGSRSSPTTRNYLRLYHHSYSTACRYSQHGYLPQSTNKTSPTNQIQIRFESSSSSPPPPPPPDDFRNHNNKDYTKLERLEDANPERIKSIIVNPTSVGYEILPGNYVYKHFKFTGNIRKVPVEFQYGFWWMVWDLKKTNNKPTLSNTEVVPERQAQIFPPLMGLKTLNNEQVDLPFSLLEGNEGTICLL